MSTTEIKTYLEELKTEFPYLVQSVEEIGQSTNSNPIITIQLSYSKHHGKERDLNDAPNVPKFHFCSKHID